MTTIPLLIQDDSKHRKTPMQSAFISSSPAKRTFTTVKQEVVSSFQQARSFQASSTNYTKPMTYDRSETITIRAIEPEYREVIAIEPLTARELEVLKLIVEGHNNPTIARNLHITMGTVKTHVRNVLKKLYVSDRTQAAIRALRSGLVH